MRAMQFPPEVSQVGWIIFAVLLVVVAVVVVLNLARSKYFGGSGQPELEDRLYLEGRLKFEEYEDRHKQVR